MSVPAHANHTPSAPPKPRLLDVVRQYVRRKRYADATEDAYCYWIRRFVLYHRKEHPRNVGADGVATEH